MKSTIKRLLALILALSMCLSLLSANVWASVASEAAEAPVTEAVEPEAEESAEEDEGQSKEDESSTEEGKNSPNEDKSEEKVTPEEEPEESEEEVTPEEEPDESEEEVTPEEEPEESEEEVTPEEEPGMSLTTQADDAISRLYIGSSAEVTSPGVVSDTGGTGTATVSLEDNTVVVTLDNFVYSGSVPCSYSSSGYTFNHYASLFYDGSAPLKILLKGENKLEAASITSGYQAVLLTNSKNLTIDNVDSASPGSLIVKYSTTSSDHARGIHLNGGRLTIAGGKVTAIGGTGTSAGSNPGVTASKLSVTGGELIAAGGSSSNGLSSGCTVTGSVSITGSDTYTVSGNTVTPGTTRPLTSSDRTSYMYISAHAHSFTYTASGSSITAACTEGCDITEGLTLTISAPTGDLTADGTTEFAATLNDDYNTTAFPGDYPITYTKDGQSFDGTPKDAGTYTASVTAGTGDGASSASVSFTIAEPAPALTIGSVEDWNTFAANVKAGNTYSGQIIRMTADVGPVTTMVGGTFSGTFDGDGHTLTVNISGGNASVATFETVSNATFQDLTLAGSVTSAGIHIAALVKSANGTCTIKHVNVNANVNCSQAYIGGFIGHAGTGNTINIENSVFSGSINKTGSGQGNFIGGFIGWSQTCTATISNCAFTGSYSNIKSFNNIGFSYNAPKSITVTNFYSNASEVFVANVNHGTRLYIPSSAYPNAVALVENGDNRTIYTTFSDALTAWTAGTTLMPLTDVTATDAITTSDTKTLDLNGKTLTLNSEMSVAEGTLTIQGTSGGEMVRQNATLIRVSEGATLDIESGTISGTGTKDRAAIHVYGTVNLNGGTVQSAASNAFSLLANVVLNLNGGTVSSNSDSSTMTTSSAVLAKNESNITINLSGSTVTTNAGCGIYTMNKSTTVNISGGSVQSGSYALRGAQGTIQLSGAPDLGENGIYLLDGQKITVTSALSNTSAIGITMASPGVFTNTASANLAHNDASKFKSDNGSYIVGKNADGQLLLGAPCTVTYASGEGSGTMADTNSPYASGSSVTVLANEFTETEGNRPFMGFKIGDSDTIYANAGDSISGAATTFTISGNTTLTAQRAVASVTANSATTNYRTFAEAVSAWNSAANGATLKLLADVETASTISVSGTKTLDLNGCGLKRTGTGRVISIVSGATLTLTDSGDTEHKYTIASPAGNGAGLAAVNDSATGDNVKTFTGGYITGGSINENGGGILVTGTLNMTGGTIIGNRVPSSSGNYTGGGIYVDGGGKLDMTGGAIIGNTATYGGGIGSTVPSGNGSTVLNLSGGTIEYNKSTDTAGGVHGNAHTNNALRKIELTITGTVSIQNNHTDGKWSYYAYAGGGVVIDGVGHILNLSGAPTIQGNTAGEGTESHPVVDNNLCFTNRGNPKMRIGELSNTELIGVTMQTPGVFTSTASANLANNDAGRFKSDNGSYLVGKNAAGQLLLGAPCSVTYNANGGSGAPTDSSSPYASGSSVAVLAKGSLARDDYIFAGWKIGTANTIYANSADSISGATESFTISGNTTLTAQWTAIPATAPTISVQPQDLTLTYGYTEGSLSVTAEAATDTTYNALAYQWYSCDDADKTNPQEISGAASANYAIPTGKNAGTTEYYYCVVTATRSDNGQTATATSNVATVTVNAATYTVTYKVVNGTWSDDSTTDQTETVQSGSKPANVPTGMKASEGFTGGAWDTDPTDVEITEATTFTYTYAQKDSISQTVTFKVVNGSWNEGEGEAATEDKTVTLNGYEGDTLKLKADQIPAVGSKPNDTYKAGSWDVTPSTETAITEATTYTYTYAQKDSISQTVTFKVVNGSWNEGEGEAATEDKTVTLNGYEGDTLKLKADQIPPVGSKPNDTYKAGSWDVTPSTETAITEATTYTYTYAQKDSISQTVTFKVVNGSWNEGEGEAATEDKTVTLTGYEGDTLKLSADQIPAVGSKPNDTYKAGSWDVTPSTETAITEATTYTYTYAQKDSISQTVTFKVVNGSWNEGEGEAATEDKTVTLTGYEGDTLKLSADQIPAVGSKPNDTYKAGSWDVTPSTETAITEATTYTYTYAQKDSISQTVTFKVVNGSWNEGEGEAATEDKTVTLTGYEGDTLKLSADQIPAVGSKPNDTCKAGSWDVTPSTETAITEATTYTYTYAQKDSISQTVTFKVVNGSWNEGEGEAATEDKTVTLTGYEGDTLKLSADQIPAVGSKPNDTCKAGSWDVTPSTETAITEATTYTYTYAQKDSISQTVTFKVVNGSWNEGEAEAATEDKTVTLTGYEGDTLKLKADQIPAVGSKPNDTYKAGSWDVTPSTETAITEATTFTYTYAQKDSISQTVTFKVVNGSWNEGEGEAATEDKTVTLTGYEGDTLKLSADQIPAVGSKPNDTYKAGSWDVTPSTETAITEATTYTYTYAQKDSISQTVTFKVVNGSWNEGEGEAATEDKTVTLTGYEGDTLKLSADQIPAVGSKPNDTYKAGSWDVTPSTETAITEATTYTYTYTQKDSISQTVTFKVVNGSWNEGEGEAATEDKTVTLTGYEGDTLKLSADQIPAVGSKPNDTYKAGSWDVTPSTETTITEATTYTYTYAQKDSISQTVTFKVVNGSWNEGEGEAATEDKTVTLTGYEGDTLKLKADQIPAVGSKPNDTYKAGSWDVTPSTETAITEATTYTYTYTQKEKAVVTKAPKAKTLTYTGSAQKLVTAGEATGGTMYYALGTDAATSPAGDLYTTSIPAKTDAGTSYVWYKVVGDDNHNDSDAACVTVTINNAPHTHNWSDWNVATPATCVAKGKEKRTCSGCGKTETRDIDIDSRNHTGKTEIKGDIEATTTEEGYTGDTYCADCHVKLKAGEVIPKRKKEEPKKEKITAVTNFCDLRLRMDKRGKDSIKVKWAEKKDADGYMVYGGLCTGKENEMELLKTIKNNKTTSWTHKKLKEGTSYKYKVVAYKNVKGEKKSLYKSMAVHVFTKGGKYTVAKGVKVNKSEVKLKKGKTFQIEASEVKDEKKKDISQHRAICYESSNDKVATVSSKGKVKAKKKGSATVFVYSETGAFKKVKVIVK